MHNETITITNARKSKEIKTLTQATNECLLDVARHIKCRLEHSRRNSAEPRKIHTLMFRKGVGAAAAMLIFGNFPKGPQMWRKYDKLFPGGMRPKK